MMELGIRRCQQMLQEAERERESWASHESWWPTKETKERVEQNMRILNFLEMLNG